MTLIIKEMAIKISLQESQDTEAKGKEKTTSGGKKDGESDMVAIVVEKVMETLHENLEP